MDFTFCTLSYNQEKYILDHLESIKFQIDLYGKEHKYSYILSDDCSKDRTVEIVEKWLENNGCLFENVVICSNKQNLGLVGNFKKALSLIKTDKFKILAGDDFYYYNNVIENFTDCNFLVSPEVNMSYDFKYCDDDYKMIKKMFAYEANNKKLKHFILNQYKYGGCLKAPSTFFSTEILDEGLYEELSSYKWIEDAPTWVYLLNKEETKVSICIKPLVVYRGDVGISNSNNHHRHSSFDEEKKLLNKKIYTRKVNIPKFINVYAYMRKIELLACDIMVKLRKEKRSRVEMFSNELMCNKDTAEKYFELIHTRSTIEYKRIVGESI